MHLAAPGREQAPGGRCEGGPRGDDVVDEGHAAHRPSDGVELRRRSEAIGAAAAHLGHVAGGSNQEPAARHAVRRSNGTGERLGLVPTASPPTLG